MFCWGIPLFYHQVSQITYICFVPVNQIWLLCPPFQGGSSTSKYHLSSNPAASDWWYQVVSWSTFLSVNLLQQFSLFCTFFSFRLMFLRCSCTSYHFSYGVQQTLPLINHRLVIPDNKQWIKTYIYYFSAVERSAIHAFLLHALSSSFSFTPHLSVHLSHRLQRTSFFTVANRIFVYFIWPTSPIIHSQDKNVVFRVTL